MDFRIRHWRGYHRRFPSPYLLASADLIERKDHWVRHAFDTYNFSLILRGRGEFHRLDTRWPVEAPCVITQWPGEQVEYGPAQPDETWDEFFMIYGAEVRPWLMTSGFVTKERPVWPIHEPVRVRALVEEYLALAAAAHPERVVDRVDRVCERLVLETLLAEAPSEAADPAVQALVAEVQQIFTQAVDFDALARRHGLSRATFRRRWAAMVGTPPARHLQVLRMREACRLLVETNRPVREISAAVGFVDELYFSRRFRLEKAVTPSEYRKTYTLSTGRGS